MTAAPRFTLSLTAALLVHALALLAWRLEPIATVPPVARLMLRFSAVASGAPAPALPSTPKRTPAPPETAAAPSALEPPTIVPVQVERAPIPARVEDSATAPPAKAAGAESVLEPVPAQIAAAREADDGQGANAQVAAVRVRYEQALAAWLDRHKYYPTSLRRRGLEGEGVLRVTLARDGKVTDLETFAALPDSLLERVAHDWVRRADPFPAVPEEIPGREYAVRFPVRFDLR